MNAIRRADVTARVVAWHNRHPLARRIGPDHVGVIGVVALPFALAPSAPGHKPALTPLFGDDWMYRWRARRLGAWSQRHGVEALPEGADWPARAIDVDPALARAAEARGLSARTLRHVLTAAIDADGRRTRVLLSARGALRGAPVFGQRLPGAGRQATLAGAGVALGAWLGAAAWWPPGAVPAPPHAGAVARLAIAADAAIDPNAAIAAATPSVPDTPQAQDTQDAPAAPPGAAEPAASTAGDAAPVVPAGDAPAAAVAGVALPRGAATPATPAAQGEAATAGPAPADMPAPTVAALAAPSGDPAGATDNARPLDTGPVLRLRDDGAPPLVDIRPRLPADERQAARRQAAALRPQPQAVRVDATVYAIATAPARTRDDALAQQALLQGLLAQSVTAVPTRLDVMSTQGRWRAVWWPHPRREDAQALLQAARARGLAVELIAF
jgi:hypothetical protein